MGKTIQMMSWMTEKKKIKIISYHQSNLFKKLEKLAYSSLPFKNKRQRVKWRRFFKYYHLRKANNDLTKTLIKSLSPKPDFSKLSEEISKTIDESFWDIKTI